MAVCCFVARLQVSRARYEIDLSKDDADVGDSLVLQEAKVQGIPLSQLMVEETRGAPSKLKEQRSRRAKRKVVRF